MSSLTDIWTEFRERYVARHEPENIRPLAEMYWRGLLGLMLALVVGALLWGVWEFVGVLENLNATPMNSSTPPVALDRKLLEATLAAYEHRQAAFDALKSAPQTYVDPSK